MLCWDHHLRILEGLAAEGIELHVAAGAADVGDNAADLLNSFVRVAYAAVDRVGVAVATKVHLETRCYYCHVLLFLDADTVIAVTMAVEGLLGAVARPLCSLWHYYYWHFPHH